MGRVFILAALLLLAGCTSAVVMRNPTTGETAKCGPYTDTWTTPERERQCIQDYQRQGFERAP